MNRGIIAALAVSVAALVVALGSQAAGQHPAPKGRPITTGLVLSTQVPIEVGHEGQAIAICPPGMVVTGGGVWNEEASTFVVSSYPVSSQDNGTYDAWIAVAENHHTDTAFLQARAICVRGTSSQLIR